MVVLSRLFSGLCILGTLGMLAWHAYWSLQQGRDTPGFDLFFLIFVSMLALPYIVALALLAWRNGRAGLRYAFGAALINAVWAVPLATLLVLFGGLTASNRDQLHQLYAVAIAALLQIVIMVVAGMELWHGRGRVIHTRAVSYSWLISLALPLLASGVAWIYFSAQVQAFKGRSTQAAHNSSQAQETVKLLQSCLAAHKDGGYPAKLPACAATVARTDAASGYFFDYFPALPDSGRIDTYLLCARPIKFRSSGFELVVADGTGVYGAGTAEQAPRDRAPTCVSVLGVERAIALCAYDYAARNPVRGYPARLSEIAWCVSEQRSVREVGADRLTTYKVGRYAYIADPPDATGRVVRFRIHQLGGASPSWIDNQLRENEKKSTTADSDLSGLPAVAAPEKFEPGCAEGRATDCFLVGHEWQRTARQAGYGERDEAARPLRETAIKAFTRGCELGDAQSCLWLANDIQHGIGAERDVAAAVKLYEKACELGYGLGCRNAAEMYETGRQAQLPTLQPLPPRRGPFTPKEDVPKNLSRAVEYYGRACELNESESCFIAARLLSDDDSIDLDRAKALVLFSRMCLEGVAVACTRAAALGNDRAPDFQRRACALSESTACSRYSK